MLTRNQISDDSHRSISGNIVHKNGKVVLSVSGSLPDLDVGRQLPVGSLPEFGWCDVSSDVFHRVVQNWLLREKVHVTHVTRRGVSDNDTVDLVESDRFFGEA